MLANTVFAFKRAGLFALLLGGAVAVGSCSNDDDDDDLNNQDREFVRMAAISNVAEIQAGQLAADKSTDASVKMFGQKMVTDHADAMAKLKSMATEMGMMVADTVDAENRAVKAMLDAHMGRAFDSIYVHSQVNAHNKSVSLFEQQVSGGNNQRLKEFAQQTLPHLRMHKAMADTMVTRF